MDKIPEDIANAIWDIVKNKRTEVVVGLTFLASLSVGSRFDAVGDRSNSEIE